MKTAKTLADFKQEIAEKYGFKRWTELHSSCYVNKKPFSTGELWDEVVKRLMVYNDTIRLQEANEAYAKGFNDGVNESAPDGFVFTLKAEYDKGWNEALQWAAEQSVLVYNKWWSDMVEKRQILKGLKP